MRLIDIFGIWRTRSKIRNACARMPIVRAHLMTVIVSTCIILNAVPAAANTIVLEQGDHRAVLDRAVLLARPDAQDIEITGDVGYGGSTRRYRAVPLSAILGLVPALHSTRGTLEAVALDGYAAQIPLSIAVANQSGAARAWLAIELPHESWPMLPNKSVNAGPFYVVWQAYNNDRIPDAYWPYQVSILRMIAHPAERWPQMAVDPRLPSEHPARRGQEVFISQCLVCHRINGAGSSDIGPDMNRPMNPTEYFQISALQRYLRDPASVRTWPAQSMSGFTTEQISDDEMNDLLAYLAQMATQRTRP